MSSFRRGWRDYQAGSSFAAEYERWTPHQQLAYERGRRAAAVASYHVPGTVCTSWSAARAAIPKGLRASALREVR